MHFQTLCAFVVVSLERPEIVHVGVTAHPTGVWVAQRMVEGVGDASPRYFLNDRDAIYDTSFRARLRCIEVRCSRRLPGRRMVRHGNGHAMLFQASAGWAMTTATKLPYAPFDEYLILEANGDVKHEWINGLIVAMSRGTPEHGRLTASIVRALPQTEECRVYSSDTLLYIERANHSTYADASIVCGAILTRGAKDKNGRSLGEAVTNPGVVVEVLSRSTEGRDRNERFLLFQQLDSLEEYVLISQDERRIEIRRRTGHEWTSEIRSAGEAIRIHGHDIAVDAIYA